MADGPFTAAPQGLDFVIEKWLLRGNSIEKRASRAAPRAGTLAC
jgi:hypothetical protein